jgi:hypothetical protein
LALLTAATAYAQRALPGEAFYPWKLASENTWRLVTPDTVGFDLLVAERRLEELIAVQDDPALYAQTLDAYLEVKERLQGSSDPRIQEILDAQTDDLNAADLLPEPTDPGVISPLESPTATPPDSSPLPVQTPRVAPTELPQIVPTGVESLPDVVPTVVENPPVVVPTVVESLPDAVATIQNLPEIIPTLDLLP